MKTTATMQKTQSGQPAVSTLVSIAIGKLAKSSLNVRKKEPGGIAELADLIKSQGLIHNLVVTEQQKKKKKTGKYEVVAGGRRLAALQLLVAEGRLSDADEVNCRIVSMDEALEMSLAENSGREAMHPADLVMAYRNLTDAGLAPDEIAPRFGVSPLTVKRYLKLTHVSPVMFTLYADDKMNFEQISTLALTDDHDLQERIWNDTPEWQRNGANIRRLITGTEIDITRNPLARFVGVETYEAAGGVIRRDLFKDADEGYMQDAELLESLALEKLNGAVESVKGEGFAWVEVHTTFDYSDEANFGRMRTQSREPTDAEQAQMNALEAQLEAIEADSENYDEDADETIVAPISGQSFKMVACYKKEWAVSEKKRNIFSSQFKAKVALEALRGVKTVNEIAQEFGVHPTQVGLWKKELQEQAAGLFDAKRGPKPVDQSASPERLYSEIGRLKMELEKRKPLIRRSGVPRKHLNLLF